ncbi:hypothetical protein Bca52824_037378 [Brassica carinata]|uniref:Uncharacterized protein n=1 Tax=Brassica carinata TaxID=52824 RepID=A0A8X7V5Y4_BRACI|nr:hypothetical protein Bca52824_037378 [Brassica carinata]
MWRDVKGFPEDKHDAIRMASTLHSKLQGMIKDLKDWKIESPANLLFDKTEREKRSKECIAYCRITQGKAEHDQE